MKSFYSILLLSFFYLLSPTVIAQTSTSNDHNKKAVFDLGVEFGPYFHSKGDLREQYSTQSALQWRLETRFGGGQWKVLPFFAYGSFSKYVLVDSVNQFNPADTLMKMKAKRDQLSYGITAPIPLNAENFLDISFGITTNIISESFTELEKIKSTGFQMRIGYRHQFNNYFSIKTNFGYDYLQRRNASSFRDWGGWSFTGGLAVNLAANK